MGQSWQQTQGVLSSCHLAQGILAQRRGRRGVPWATFGDPSAPRAQHRDRWAGWEWQGPGAGRSLDGVGHAVRPHAPHHAQLLQRRLVLPLLGEDLLFWGFRLHQLLPPLGRPLDAVQREMVDAEAGA